METAYDLAKYLEWAEKEEGIAHYSHLAGEGLDTWAELTGLSTDEREQLRTELRSMYEGKAE